jgi:hypothetical protein
MLSFMIDKIKNDTQLYDPNLFHNTCIMKNSKYNFRSVPANAFLLIYTSRQIIEIHISPIQVIVNRSSPVFIYESDRPNYIPPPFKTDIRIEMSI